MISFFTVFCKLICTCIYVYIKAISFLAKFLQNIYPKAKRSLENRSLIY